MKKEIQTTRIAYICDYCDGEGTEWYMEVVSGINGKDKHYHRNLFVGGDEETCFEKYEKELEKET